MTSLLRGLIGSGGQAEEPTGVETVEKLCDRVETATLADDRRDALRGLKAMSKNFRLEVGTRAMDLLVNTLKNDRTDLEMVEYALETILNLVESGNGDPNDLGLQFSEIFLKKADNVVLVLGCLEEFEFKVRMLAVRVLTNLLHNKVSAVQQVILESPMGISRLMDILADRREVIRNDALLLLTYLTKDNTQIQKIVAFENAFERLMDIIEVEGYSDGGIIVKDCLIIMHTMLVGNNSNQALFREASLIQRLVPFLDLDLTDVVLKALDPTQSESPPPSGPVSTASVEEHDSIVTSYKDLIRDLDSELMTMRGKQKELEEELSTKSSLVLQQMSEIQILKEQLGNLGKSPQDDSGTSPTVVAELQGKILLLHSELEEQRKEMQTKDRQILALSNEADMLRKTTSPGSSPSNDVMVQSLQDTVENLKAENEALLTEKAVLDAALEKMQQNERDQVSQVVTENSNEGRVAQLEKELQKATRLCQDLENKLEVVEKEQEDLLVLLADNDAKVNKYKELLLEHNLDIPTSDEDDDDDDDEEEN